VFLQSAFLTLSPLLSRASPVSVVPMLHGRHFNVNTFFPLFTPFFNPYLSHLPLPLRVKLEQEVYDAFKDTCEHPYVRPAFFNDQGQAWRQALSLIMVEEGLLPQCCTTLRFSPRLWEKDGLVVFNVGKRIVFHKRKQQCLQLPLSVCEGVMAAVSQHHFLIDEGKVLNLEALRRFKFFEYANVVEEAKAFARREEVIYCDVPSAYVLSVIHNTAFVRMDNFFFERFGPQPFLHALEHGWVRLWYRSGVFGDVVALAAYPAFFLFLLSRNEVWVKWDALTTMLDWDVFKSKDLSYSTRAMRDSELDWQLNEDTLIVNVNGHKTVLPLNALQRVDTWWEWP